MDGILRGEIATGGGVDDKLSIEGARYAGVGPSCCEKLSKKCLWHPGEKGL